MPWKCDKNEKKYDWTQVSMGWVINRKKDILGMNYSFNSSRQICRTWVPNCSRKLGRMHWSQWKPVEQLRNKHYFWTIVNFIKYLAQENKSRHVTFIFLLCWFSMCTLYNVIEVSKEHKVCLWTCQVSQDCPPFPVWQPNLTIPPWQTISASV